MDPSDSKQFLIAVHCGAGYHSPKLEKEYRTAMEKACLQAAAVLGSEGNCEDAVATATVVLEDCPITNAGLGSNLTEDGKVEGDASLMTDDKCFGAVGACPGIKNPILVAHRVGQESLHPMPLGRVRPILLVGDGARQWALRRNIEAAVSIEDCAKWNVTRAAEKQWRIYKDMIDRERPAWELEDQKDNNTSIFPAKKRQKISSGTANTEDGRINPPFSPLCNEGPVFEERGLSYDTVGCICVDSQGRCAASVSSGGIAVKSSGRIGEAAIYGSGCWAEARPNLADTSGRSKSVVACSVTGVGENIMRASLAKTACQRILSGAEDLGTACQKILQSEILESPPPGPPVPPTCGIISLEADVSIEAVELKFAAVHSSASMAFGWFHSGMKSPNCKIDRTSNTAHQASPEVAVFGLQTSWRRTKALSNRADV